QGDDRPGEAAARQGPGRCDDAPLDFEAVDAVSNGNAGDVVAQVYRFQNWLLQNGGHLVGSETAIAQATSATNIMAMSNEMRAVLVE
ncbi:hypothetical protein, partial [Bosea sp. 67-29]|uniref:hypothetical protein n=1 Tax=Bosea sp. 67-29 TaxID=1895723 RepID=UPI0026395D80